MICIKAEIPNELNDINDELKAIYHSRDTVCFIFLNQEIYEMSLQKKQKGMNKDEREIIYSLYE